MITHSYIVSCLESHEVARKQVEWLAAILPPTWELIFVDDGSDPPIELPARRPARTILIRTHDTRPWTQDIARNLAARAASGRYLLMTDIDHVFTLQAIKAAERFAGNMTWWRRACGRFAVSGCPERVNIKCHPVPPNIFLIRRDVFFELGGYDESLCIGRYTATDHEFLARYKAKHGKIPTECSGPVYVIPEPLEQFHRLSRTEDYARAAAR